MHGLWITSIFSTLVSTCVLVIIFSQNPKSAMLNSGIVKQQGKLETLNTQHMNQVFLRVMVEKQVVQATKVVEDLEAKVAKMGSELEKRKSEHEACEAEKVIHFSFIKAILE